MAKQQQGQKYRPLILAGPTDALSRPMQARMQCYRAALQMIPSGNRTAHNVEVLARFLWGDGR